MLQLARMFGHHRARARDHERVTIIGGQRMYCWDSVGWIMLKLTTFFVMRHLFQLAYTYMHTYIYNNIYRLVKKLAQ
jgi:hypothetical protein